MFSYNGNLAVITYYVTSVSFYIVVTTNSWAYTCDNSLAFVPLRVKSFR